MEQSINKKSEIEKKCPLGNPLCNDDFCLNPRFCPKSQAKFQDSLKIVVESITESTSKPRYSLGLQSRNYKSFERRLDIYLTEHTYIEEDKSHYKNRGAYNYNLDYSTPQKGLYHVVDPIKGLGGISKLGYSSPHPSKYSNN